MECIRSAHRHLHCTLLLCVGEPDVKLNYHCKYRTNNETENRHFKLDTIQIKRTGEHLKQKMQRKTAENLTAAP